MTYGGRADQNVKHIHFCPILSKHEILSHFSTFECGKIYLIFHQQSLVNNPNSLLFRLPAACNVRPYYRGTTTYSSVYTRKKQIIPTSQPLATTDMTFIFCATKYHYYYEMKCFHFQKLKNPYFFLI